jgi:cellulose synthase (UDP-forming)
MIPNSIKLFWADWQGRLPYHRYLDREDRPRRLRAQGLCALTLLAGGAYLAWLGRQAYILHDLYTYVFLAAELLAYLLLFLLGIDVWRLRWHRPEGIRSATNYGVDILVTCCGEPLEVIKTTLLAVKQIRYDSAHVYVLDDAGSLSLANLARSLGFQYHSRSRQGLDLKDSKSGNLNFGLGVSKSEIILCLDADQVPHPEIISRMIGFFDLPRLAYVQSKQHFCLPDDDPFFNRDEIFYETIQVSNDQANAVISCGSGVLYRRQALEEIGGFITWNLVEDLATSYELVSRGWKGIYFPYALSRGLAPDTLQGVFRQRFQWSLDTMRLFFWDNPLAKPGLTITQRLHFLILMVTYLISGLVLPIFYLLPLYSYCTGKSFLMGREWYYLFLRGGYLFLTILAFRYLFYKKDALKQFKILCGLFPVYAAAILAAIWYVPGQKPKYRVNNADSNPIARRNWHLLSHLTLVSLHLILPFLSLHYGWASPRLIVTNSFFSAFTIWVLGEMIIISLSRPQWKSAMDPKLVYGLSDDTEVEVGVRALVKS